MPEVYLTAAELKGKRDLPRCCVVCGRQRANLERVSFAANAGTKWNPFLGSTTTMRHLTVSLPLCREHRDYFNKWGYLLLYLIAGVFALFVVLMVVSVVAAMTLGAKAGFVIVPLWFLAFAAIVGFGLFAVLGTRSGVSTRGIERRGMRLANVAPEFADTLEDLREQAGPEGADAEEFDAFSEDRPGRRPPRSRSRRSGDDDDDGDDSPPRRRPRRRDDF